MAKHYYDPDDYDWHTCQRCGRREHDTQDLDCQYKTCKDHVDFGIVFSSAYHPQRVICVECRDNLGENEYYDEENNRYWVEEPDEDDDEEDDEDDNEDYGISLEEYGFYDND